VKQIVGGKNESSTKPSTVLPATIEYFTPYLTSEGTPATLKIAIGHEVGVNTILGISTIKTAKLSIDLSDNVVDPGILSTQPFPISFKPTSRGIPDLSSVDANFSKTFQLQEPSKIKAWHTSITSCEEFIDDDFNKSAEISTAMNTKEDNIVHSTGLDQSTKEKEV
jgi:hypothetical protein